jgi:hypothetical protein
MKTSTQVHSQIGKILLRHKVKPVFGVDSVWDIQKRIAWASSVSCIKDACKIGELYRELKYATRKEEWCA